MSAPKPKARRPVKERGTEVKGRDKSAKPNLASSLARAMRRPSAPGSRWPAWVQWAAVAVVGIAAATAAWLFFVFPSGRGPGEGRDVEVVIADVETVDSLTEKLEAAGLLRHPGMFALYLKLSGGTDDLVKGPHLLTDDASPRELLARLERRPGAAKVRVTFPEGWTRFDMARRLQEKRVCTLRAFLEATTARDLLKELRIDGESAEGYLFPATYELALDSDPGDVVRRMKAEFDRRYSAIEQRHQAQVLELGQTAKFGMREILVLASMIEKEAAVDEERATIASVFLNRLRDPEFHPKLLQCDPTAGYGCLVAGDKIPSCAGYSGKITPAINADAANPYSTYKHEGLPPGPISNPGAKSLEAAMAPAQSRYLYFVARGEGRHTFSETYSAHNAAVRDGGARGPARLPTP